MFGLVIAGFAITSLMAFADDSVPDAGFSISSSEIERDDLYARISSNTTFVAFYLNDVNEPVVREECRLGNREVLWDIVDEPAGGCSDRDADVFIVNFSPSTDFGKTYDITATLKWMVYDEATEEAVDEISETAHYTLDAILYSFSVACSDGCACYNNVSPLVDNHPADAIVTPSGCTRRDPLDLMLTSVPEEANPLNKAGTAMPFLRTEDPCVLHTRKTYWYGLAEPNDCFLVKYYYIFTLRSDFEVVAQLSETVGWPDEHPEMSMDVSCVETFPEISPIGNGRYILRIKPWRFLINTDITYSTDQYAAETAIEEEYHEKQARGLVGLECGGEPDLYDMSRVFAAYGPISSDGYYVAYSLFGETKDEFKARILYSLHLALKLEMEESASIWNRDRGFREKVAKSKAGYNAAWRYHCTYGNPNAGIFQYAGLEEDQKQRMARE